jgi:hypothetical protein
MITPSLGCRPATVCPPLGACPIRETLLRALVRGDLDGAGVGDLEAEWVLSQLAERGEAGPA